MSTAPVNDQRGFAMVAVLLVLALLGVVAAELVAGARLEASMARANRVRVQSRHLAEAGVQQAIREIVQESQIQGLDEQGQVVFYRTAVGQTTPTRLPPLPRQRVDLGPGSFSYRIADEESRLEINASAPDRLGKLLDALGVDRQTRDVIVDSVQDWRDPNDEHRANGAESEDYYLKLPVPYRARNGNLQDVAELLQIRGVTPAIYWGDPRERGRPGLVDVVAVTGRRLVNLNTAPPPVLEAVGFAGVEISEVLQSRGSNVYATVPGRFAGRGLGVGSQTFRVEAEGTVPGEPPLRLVAVIQRRARTGTTLPSTVSSPPVAILAWREVLR